MLPYSTILKPVSRQLRANMTDAERRLWLFIRRKQIHGVQFYRQKPIANYIVDFHAPAVKLVIEVDGSQHMTSDGIEKDQFRDSVLATLGLHVLRYDNRRVLTETEEVVSDIAKVIEERLGKV